MEYYIFITNDCNLKCSYCSILVDSRRHDLPLEPVYDISALNNFINEVELRKNSQRADIIFFGGEPTLNTSFIEKLISTLRPIDNQYVIRYMLHTNGLLLEHIPDSILQNIEAIMLSINYSKIPNYNLHEGYLNTIVKGIRDVKCRKNIPIIGRLTIAESTSLYACAMQVHPFFDYLHWQIENCVEFKDFGKFSKAYSYDLLNLLDVWYSYLQRGILLNFVPFVSCIQFMLENKTPTVFNCGYNDSMVYIQTDGACYTCAEDFMSNHSLIGSIYNGVKFPNFNLGQTICTGCEYLNICHGRCGRMHKDLPPSRIKEYCKLNKVHFDYLHKRCNTIKELCESKNIDIRLQDEVLVYTEHTP